MHDKTVWLVVDSAPPNVSEAISRWSFGKSVPMFHERVELFARRLILIKKAAWPSL